LDTEDSQCSFILEEVKKYKKFYNQGIKLDKDKEYLKAIKSFVKSLKLQNNVPFDFSK